jgi:hypothetical protein
VGDTEVVVAMVEKPGSNPQPNRVVVCPVAASKPAPLIEAGTRKIATSLLKRLADIEVA